MRYLITGGAGFIGSHLAEALLAQGDRVHILDDLSTGSIDNVRHLIEQGNVPMFGICLGHQILGHAVGGTTFKLKFGHRGANHPVKDLASGKVEITSQNHGFAVDPDSLPANVTVTHTNLYDGTVEGFRHTDKPIFSVQYHPEASPGPHDADYLFRQFLEVMEK